MVQVYCISAHHGRRVMLAGVISEWLNIVFKWILFGHRPYWWVHLNGDVGGVEQYRVTCETGPGSPSGHCMVTAAVYYVIADACSLKMPKWIPFSIFCLAMVPINVARLFTSTHFPHQVIAGTICGVVIGLLMDKYAKVQHWKLANYLLVAAILFFGCMGFSWSLGILGVDLHWSLPIAKKWCKNSEWISLNTTPHNSVVRDSFVLAGYGVSETMVAKNRGILVPGSKISALVQGFLSLVAVGILEKADYSSESPLSFYTFSAIKHSFIPCIVVFLVPFILSKLTTQDAKKYK